MRSDVLGLSSAFDLCTLWMQTPLPPLEFFSVNRKKRENQWTILERGNGWKEKEKKERRCISKFQLGQCLENVHSRSSGCFIEMLDRSSAFHGAWENASVDYTKEKKKGGGKEMDGRHSNPFGFVRLLFSCSLWMAVNETNKKKNKSRATQLPICIVNRDCGRRHSFSIVFKCCSLCSDAIWPSAVHCGFSNFFFSFFKISTDFGMAGQNSWVFLVFLPCRLGRW